MSAPDDKRCAELAARRRPVREWLREKERQGITRHGDFSTDIGICSVCGSPWLSVAHLSWSNYGHCLRCMECWALGPRRRSAKRAAQLHGRMWQVTHGKRIRQVYRRTAILGATETQR